MTQWIRCDYRYLPRCAVFEAGVMELVMNGFSDVYPSNDDNIEHWGLLLKSLLVINNPKLSGCLLESIEFSYDKQMWSIGVSHESLGEVEFGDCLPRFPLIHKKHPFAEAMKVKP